MNPLTFMKRAVAVWNEFVVWRTLTWRLGVACLACAASCLLVSVETLAQEPMRKWTSDDGRYSFEGRFIRIENAVVILEASDGRLIDVPLERLSKADIEYAKSPERASQSTDIADARRRNDFWDYRPIAIERLNSSVTRIPIQEVGRDFASRQLISPDRTLMVFVDTPMFTPHPGRPGPGSVRDSEQLRVTEYDLTTGQQSSQYPMAPCTLAGISPDNRHLLVFNPLTRFQAKLRQLFVVVRSSQGKTTYEIESAVDDFAAAYFVDSSHVMAVGTDGKVEVINFSQKKSVWTKQFWPGSVAALTPSGDHVVGMDHDGLKIMDSRTGKLVGQAYCSAAGTGFMSVNDEGTKAASVGKGLVRVWDLTQGREIANFSSSSMLIRPHYVAWLDDRYLMAVSQLNSVYEVIDIEQRVPVCCYFSNVALPHRHNGEVWHRVHVKSAANQGFERRSLPPVDAGVESIARDLAVDLKAGDAVSIHLDAAPEYDRAKEMAELTELFTAAGYRVVAAGGTPFHAVLRSKDTKVYDAIDLKDVPDEAFRRRVELSIRVGNEM
ncbi:MAG TPA: SHD1 domain-containing protein, partial [Pirellulaceae bacterium]|nr:SHD1 domain-containing protein [Pirellulaceae bacterium]